MAAGESSNPVLWSDFDGTAVETVGLLNPRNWAKYPLDGVPGYEEFLEGVQEGEVDIGGIVSRRPNIFPRRFVTARSIADLGLQRFFPDADSVVLAGSEAAKGAFVALEALEGQRPVGIVDDKPHRVGTALIAAMRKIPLENGRRIAPVTLGAVNHDRTEEYMASFIEAMQAAHDDTGISVTESSEEHSFVLRAPERNFRLNVVGLPEYSTEAGQAFAERLFGHCYA
jgi:hypothetical protein